MPLNIQAFPTTRTWNVDGNSNWNNAANWTGSEPDARTEIAGFGNLATATTATVTIDQNTTTLNGFSFTSTTTAYTIQASSGTRTFRFQDETNGGLDPIISVSGNQAHTIQNGSGTVRLQINSDTTSDLTIDNNSSAGTGLTIGTSIRIIGTSNKTLTLSGTGTTSISGIIEETSTGVLSLSKSGTGTVVFTADNTYGGTTTISGGVLESQIVSGLGDAGVTLSGGTFKVSTVDQTYGNVFTISSGSTIEVDSGRIFTLGDGANDLTGAGLLTKSGAGTLTLAHFHDHTGGWSMDAGTVISQASGALGTGNITLNGGTLSITTVDQSYTQTFTVSSASTIDVGAGRTMTLGNAANDLTGGGTLTKTGSGTLTLGFANNLSGGITMTSGTVQASASGALGTGTLTFNGGNLKVDTADQSYSQSVAATGTVDINVDASRTLTLSGTISGGAGLTKSGNGTLILSGNNSYSGATTVSAGVLNIQHNNALGATTGDISISNGAELQLQNNITVGSGEDVTSVQGTGFGGVGAIRNISGANTYNGAITLAGATTIGSDAGTLTLAGNISNGANLLTVTGSGNTTISGVIGSGAGGLTKTGTGTLTLSGNNTYTGDTTLSAGVLNIQHNNALGATSGNISIANGAELQLQNNISVGAGEDITSVQGTGVGGSGAIRNISGANSFGGTIALVNATTIGSDSGTLTLSGNMTTAGNTLTVTGAGNTTITGSVTGAGSLTKTGSGTLTLSNSGNSFAGTLSISDGTVATTTTGALGSGASPTIGSSGTLSFGSVGTESFGTVTLTSGTITRTVTSASDSSFTASGGVTSSGNSTISSSGAGGGALVVDADISITSGTLTLNPSASAKVSVAGSTTRTLSIAAGSSLIGTGSGTVVFDNDRVISGAGTGSGSESKVTMSTSGGVTVATSPKRLDVSFGGGDDNYGLRIEGKKSNVDFIASATTLAQTSASSTGTLTIAYDDAGSTTLLMGSGYNPLAATALKLGFDNAGAGSPSHYLSPNSDNELSNWGGLVVKGGTVGILYDTKFVGLTGSGTRTTLDVLGGTLSLETVTSSKLLWVTGDINLQAGTVNAGSGGGGHGWIKGERDVIIASGFTMLNNPKLESAPASGDEARIRGTGTLSGSNQLETFLKTGAGDTRLEIALKATASIDLQGTGSLILNSSDLIDNSTGIKMAGATLKTGGNDDTVGTLTLSNNSYIDFGGSGTYGSDNSVLSFADSSAVSWNSSTLYLLNWTGKDTVGTPSAGTLDELYFGNSASGLTQTQVDSIIFVNPWIQSWGSNYVGNLPAIILPTGEVVPKIIPETRTVVLSALLGVAVMWRERRRLRELLVEARRRFLKSKL